jgi:hypothetical protein
MVSINLKNVYDGGRDYAFEDLPPTTLVAAFKVMICDRLDEVSIVLTSMRSYCYLHMIVTGSSTF